jgi:Mrp family chromosome partitioning ATPase
VDAAIIVAAAGQTTVDQIDACERELAARTNVVGVVLNRCRYMGQDYGYGEYA